MFVKTFFSLVISYLLSITISGAQTYTINNLINTISERSYIQLMRGNIPSRNQNAAEVIKTTFMEAQIAPNYFIRLGSNKRFSMAVSPRVIIRMSDNQSLPIKTPSFMPAITGFHHIHIPVLNKSKMTNWLFTNDHKYFLIYRIAHHSNGQKDEFFVPGSKRINFSTGNFSTDYLELGFQWLNTAEKMNTLSVNGRISVEQHINLTREQDLKEIYYNNRFILENEFYFTKWLQAGTRVDLMTGRGSRFMTSASYQISLELRPFSTKSDLSVFTRFYRGPDYYNIRYFSDQQFIGWGIRANPDGRDAFGF